MEDYNKLTVVQIKEEFKNRGIPTTGLTRKQQLIGRLLEDDASKVSAIEATHQEDAVGATQNETTAEPVEEITEEQEAQPDRTHDANNPETDALESPITAPFIDPIPSYAAPEQSASTPLEDTPTAVETITPPVGSQTIAETIEPALPLTSAPVEAVEQENAILHATAMAPTATAEPLSRESTTGLEASLKRKRRSLTPPVSSAEIARKKARQQEADVTHAQEVAPTNLDTEMQEAPAEAQEHDVATAAANDAMDMSTPVAPQENDAPPAPAEDTMDISTPADELPAPTPTTAAPPSPDLKKPQHPKHQRPAHLFPLTSKTPNGASDMPPTTTLPAPDRAIAPALHPATRALYIRNFMRPLHPTTLRQHLTALARAPTNSSTSTPTHETPSQNQTEKETDNQEIIQLFHIDPLKTHALLLFTTLASAARVRSALHDTVWPLERDRKPLWCDYIPEDKVAEWIDIESDGGGRPKVGGRRCEVVYTRVDDGEGGGVIAELVDANALGVPAQTQGVRPTFSPVEVRRESMATGGGGGGMIGMNASAHRHPPTPTTSAPTQQQPQTQSFIALDQLFRSTTSKPKLYYQPVPQARVDARLSEMNSRTSREWRDNPSAVSDPRSGGKRDEMTRYTFEDDDRLVDNGPEFGLRRGAVTLGSGGGRGRGGYDDDYRRGGYGDRRGGYGNGYVDRDRGGHADRRGGYGEGNGGRRGGGGYGDRYGDDRPSYRGGGGGRGRYGGVGSGGRGGGGYGGGGGFGDR